MDNRTWDFEDEDFEKDEDFEIPSLPITKEQVLAAFENLNISGQNWVMNKINAK